MIRPLLLAACLTLGLGATLAACGPDPSDDPAVADASVTVQALDNTFRAEMLTVSAGATVNWKNVGRNDHDIRPTDGAEAARWGAGPASFGPGATYSHTFTEPGTYTYFCTIHGTETEGMTGTIVVTAAGAPTSAAPRSTAPQTTTAAPSAGSAAIIRVPADQPTIQQAVDSAAAGALILVSPGTYHEAVDVTTDRLTIRGLDRDAVVLDGQLQQQNGIRVLRANGVAIENMTATNYTANGFFWTGVDGYRGSYLTSYRTGDYGLYAFDSTHGQFDHVYAAGSPDAGIYIGGCFPCDALVQQVLSEHNGLGYSGTNAGGNLLIIDSVFRYNRAGVAPNSGSYEPCYPERGTTIVGNAVYSNNQSDTPAIDIALLAMGNGIAPAGGVRNVIERNLVYDHDKAGIALVPFPEPDPNDTPPPQDDWDRPCAETKNQTPATPSGPVLWNPQQNRVIGNVLSDNRHADIILASIDDVSLMGNCFAGNTMTSTFPRNLENLAPCDGSGSGDWTDGAYDIAAWLTETHPPSADWRTAVLPPLAAQDQMPDAATAPAHPAVDVPATVDLEAIAVPTQPAA